MRDSVYDLLDYLESIKAYDHGKWIQCFLDLSREIRDGLPSSAEEALASATEFWAGRKRRPEYLETGVRYWAFLDTLERSHRSDPEHSKLRMIACLLDPEWDQSSAMDKIHFFLEMASKAGVASSLIEGTIRKRFRDVLDRPRRD
jgi:hypothetical protein